MSVDSSTSAPKWQAYCPDCGGKFLNIWIGGRVHCGNCSRGGVIWSPHYEHLFNFDRPAVRDAPEGDPMCQCPKCGRMHRDLQAGKPPMAIAGPSLLRPAESLKAVPLTAPYTIAVRDVSPPEEGKP